MKVSEPSDSLFGFTLEFDSATVFDFWRWSYSILSNDPTKGEFAEWMVAKLLGFPTPPGGRIEGADWDFASDSGVKIEVKAAAFWQAWKLRNRKDGSWRPATTEDYEKLTKPKFSGLWRRPATGKVTDADFKADLYVFCLQTEQDPIRWNGTDLTQWAFFMLGADVLRSMKSARDSACQNGQVPKSFDITLRQLETITVRMTAPEFQKTAPMLIAQIANKMTAS